MLNQIKRIGIIVRLMSEREYELAEDIFLYYFIGYYRNVKGELTRRTNF